MVRGPRSPLMFGFLLLELCVLLLEALHAAGGIDQLVFAGKIGVAMGANFNGKILCNRRVGFDLVPTGAGNGNFMHGRMDGFFHKVPDGYHSHFFAARLNFLFDSVDHQI